MASFVLSALFLQQLLNWKIRKFRNLEQHFKRIILLVDAFDSDRINGLGNNISTLNNSIRDWVKKWTIWLSDENKW